MELMKFMSQIKHSEQINTLYLLLLLIPSFLFFILKRFKTSSKFKSSPLPPGPSPWPILGNILQIGERPHLDFTSFAKTYGPLISLRFGNQLVIIGSSPVAATEILKAQDRTLSGRYVPHVAPAKSLEVNNLSLGWTLECNEYWRNLRTICRGELFSNTAISSFACIREKKVMEMLNLLRKMQGKVVKIRDVTFAAVFNIVSNILVSRDLINLDDESLSGETGKLVRDIMEVASAPNISDFYPILSPFDLQGLRKKSNELCDRSSKMWEAIIKERKETMKNGDASTQKDFLDALMNNGCPDEQINMLLLELLSAGTDTTSSAVEWILVELLRNPVCMKKVKEELAREIKQEKSIKDSHLTNMPYLQACMNEAIRLHPPSPLLLPHRATESCQIMGYTIPKDAMVLVNFWAIGRDPTHWEDPLVFKPERFLNSSLDFKGNDFQYIPFGAGRRICPGLPMAAKHVSLLAASLIHFFDWSLPRDMDPNNLDMSEKFAISMVKDESLLVVPKIKI
ncbi:hypothetical protein FEM48_Zijuj11G0043000 [Ziziphus jujuba var. spinosa]|uniref:(S)-N-methylcoclaurine 3'-hydroxylase isozyme 2 n=1 Tax=Ziziphus jujuba var. spinosa TaxID=714518 RepID=A0A978UGS6_ZIZJJ|nr:hypothetical protein FEM48_Zijuj11G0043000 [Ziziphus jujuba var. spinosa]